MSSRFRIAAGLAVFALVLAGMVFHAVGGFDTAGLTARLESLLRGSENAWPVLLILQVVIAATGVLPASVLCLLSGTVFGFGFGFGLSTVGTFLGAFCSFSVTRSFLRPAISRWLEHSPRFRRLDAVFSTGGWRLVCLARLSPVMPFALTSLSLGMSSVRFREYALGTFASLPAMAGYVAAGAVFRDGLGLWGGGREWLGWVSASAGALATLAFVIYLGRLIARALAATGDA